MIKCKLILPVLAAVAMAGCVTTEQMPDGTTKIRFSDEAVSSLTSMMPAGVVTGVANGTGGSGLDLVPTRNPARSGQYLYFNGQYDYECAAALLYSAKSGQSMDAETSSKCRQRYFSRQQELKMAGKPYDRAAPAYDAYNPPEAYWATLTGRTTSQLAAMEQFSTRFTGMPRIDRAGNISIIVGFLGVAKGQHTALVTTPERTPVAINDAGFEAQMRSKAARLNARGSEMTSCDAVLAYHSAVDKGRRPAGVRASDYARYEVRFTVASMGCQDSLYQLKAASR
ncbi:hypothetical protein [Pseudomonas sp. BP8]|uniref:hypothetical protein n=1 Tax=Pseudomonas sp. BP8 TaxID=2817864 RepID=UPI001AE36186|nr:hypothetical protein [Pseudomonas sp. BP8]MBP2260273.1 hypothetical protein [Pseudomonas sp. BP8]HDS1733922.1 hypothetical protein [Pseudomonas putida]